MTDIPPTASAVPSGPSHAAPPIAPSEFARPQLSADLTPLLGLLLAGRRLTAEQSAAAFAAIMTGQAHPGEIGAFLALLATRIPSSAEILGAATVMRQHVDRVVCATPPAQIVDTAGTGGAPKTFNVSTAAAIVAAAAGAKVAKHGNRSRTGRGSAEVLSQLGVNLEAGRATQARCLDQVGVCFCYAIHHHPATRHVMPVRQALGFPTIFNLLGPLTNPAGAGRQVMGVYDRRFLQPIAETLRDLGAVRGMVVHSNDGLDEFSIAASTNVFHVVEGRVVEDVISPREYGLNTAPLDAVTATDLPHAADMLRNVLAGQERGPARDMTLLNTAATLVVAGIASSMGQGVEQAAHAIDSGQARQTLDQLASCSRE